MARPALPNAPSPEAVAPIPSAGTRTADYPRVATQKCAAALGRVANVHARFQKELDSIAETIARQLSLSSAAVEAFHQVGPRLESMAANIRSMGESLHDVGTRVGESREGLSASMEDVQATIGRLRERNEGMRGILDMSLKVTESVNEIAEIAVENKLIAINASITASKASDKVKGFKVIATEITRISTAMADRVRLIVDRAALVGERMREVIRNMDESILSTQKALGNIDEAFRLLDHVDATIGEARAADGRMSEEEAALGAKARSLGEALSRIGANAEAAAAQSEAILSAMRQQASRIDGAIGVLPGLRAIAAAIASEALDGEGPKRLRFAEAPLSTYDPALTRMLREMHYATFTCIRLLRYSSDKRLVPYLAETWFLHADGLTWEFRLRDGVRFNDGSPVRSRDVKFSLERLINPALGSPYANLFSVIEGADEFMAGSADAVRGIILLGHDGLQIRLKSPFNSFLSLLALSYSSIIKEDPALFSRPVGRGELVSAGPFRCTATGDGEGGDSATDILVANEDFVNGPPFLDSLEIRRDVADIPHALAGSALDLAYNVPSASADALRKSGFKGNLRYYTSRYCYGLVVNFSRRNALTRQPDLRRALAMAIDKDSIVRDTLGDRAIRADSVLPAELLDLGGRSFIPYDPEGARRIVEALRGKEDLAKPITIAFRGYTTVPGLDRVAERVRAAFEGLGLKVETSLHPGSAAIASFKEDYDLVFLGFLSELDLYSAVEPFINPQGGDNYFNYDNPGLFADLNASLGIKDTRERERFFVGILERLTLDVFSIPMFFNKALLATQPWVHSVFMSAEESIIPDGAFLDASPSGDRAAFRMKEGAAAGYAAAIKSLKAETADVVRGAGGLIATGREIGAIAERQKASVGEANGLFDSFVEGATALSATLAGVVGKIRSATAEAGRSGLATNLIKAGLGELSAALGTSVKVLAQAAKDVEDMLAIVSEIGESNSFIASIAINAAVIAAKSDRRTGDLVKVAQSISEQARRNTSNTEAIRLSLEEMSRSVTGHKDFLNDLVESLLKAGEKVDRDAGILLDIRPLLEGADASCSEMEATSGGLSALIARSHEAVDRISEATGRLSQDAETLRFGLDMEQAVSDILADVVAINDEVYGFLRGK